MKGLKLDNLDSLEETITIILEIVKEVLEDDFISQWYDLKKGDVSPKKLEVILNKVDKCFGGNLKRVFLSFIETSSVLQINDLALVIESVLGTRKMIAESK